MGQQAVMAPQIVTYDPTNLYQQPNLLEQQQQQQMLVSVTHNKWVLKDY